MTLTTKLQTICLSPTMGGKGNLSSCQQDHTLGFKFNWFQQNEQCSGLGVGLSLAFAVESLISRMCMMTLSDEV